MEALQNVPEDRSGLLQKQAENDPTSQLINYFGKHLQRVSGLNFSSSGSLINVFRAVCFRASPLF